MAVSFGEIGPLSSLRPWVAFARDVDAACQCCHSIPMALILENTPERRLLARLTVENLAEYGCLKCEARWAGIGEGAL